MSEPKQSGTEAERADRHHLYQEAVQNPEAVTDLFVQVFQEVRGRKPLNLREDFCGTAHLSAHWCLSNKRRRAIGIDLDAETLEWGYEHNIEPHADEIGDRLETVRCDVLEGRQAKDGRKADVACALNFSFCVFKERSLLRHYFEAVRRTLADDGLLILEIYGGLEAIDILEEETDKDGFEYVWEQERYDPLTHETLCHISFRFPDGSEIENAFTYDWRLWSLPEIKELLLEAGYSHVRFYWETVEEDDDDDDDDEDAVLEGTGEYEEVEELEENQQSWLCWVVAER